jgi:DNA-directed RNA polymerase subunit RPC12/RpoP
MQAKLQVQMNCAECNGQLQYHENGKYVRCNTIKCSHRHVNYLAPTLELLKEKLDEPAKPARKKSAAKD